MPKRFYTREEVRAILREALEQEPQQVREEVFDAREELDSILHEQAGRRYQQGNRVPRRDFRQYRQRPLPTIS